MIVLKGGIQRFNFRGRGILEASILVLIDAYNDLFQSLLIEFFILAILGLGITILVAVTWLRINLRGEQEAWGLDSHDLVYERLLVHCSIVGWIGLLRVRNLGLNF